MNFENFTLSELYNSFDPDFFNELSLEEKKSLTEHIVRKLCQEKQLIPPPITFINDQSENFGTYNNIRNTLNINLDYILDLQLKYEQENQNNQNLDATDLAGKYPSFELLNTIFHELRHYEQKEKIKSHEIQKGIKHPLPSGHAHYILQPHEQDAYKTAHRELEKIKVLDTKDYLIQVRNNYNKAVEHAKNEKESIFNLNKIIDNIKEFFINKYTNMYYPEKSVLKSKFKQTFNLSNGNQKEFEINIVKNNEFINAEVSDPKNKIRLFVKNGKASILLDEIKDQNTINNAIEATKHLINLYNLRSNTKVENIEIIPYSFNYSKIKTNSIIDKINKNLLSINEANVNRQKLNEINQNILKDLFKLSYEGNNFKNINLLNYSLDSLIEEINQMDNKYELNIDNKRQLLEKLSEYLINNQNNYLNQYCEVQINNPIQLLLNANIISEINQQEIQPQQRNLGEVITKARTEFIQEQNMVLDNPNIDEQNR